MNERTSATPTGTGFAKPLRWAAATGGALLVITGAVATFFPARSDLGAVALIALGALLLVLAMVGAFPSRFRVGGAEFDMSVLADAMDEAELPRSSQVEILESIRRGGSETGAARHVEERLLAEDREVRSFAQRLRDALGHDFEVLEEERVPTPGRGRPLIVDVLMRRQSDGRAVAIERVSAWRPSQSVTPVSRLETAIDAGAIAAGLLVVDDAYVPQVTDALRETRVRIVRPREIHDGDALRSVLLELFSIDS